MKAAVREFGVQPQADGIGELGGYIDHPKKPAVSCMGKLWVEITRPRRRFPVFNGLPGLQVKGRQHAFDGLGLVEKKPQNGRTAKAGAHHRGRLIQVTTKRRVRMPQIARIRNGCDRLAGELSECDLGLATLGAKQHLQDPTELMPAQRARRHREIHGWMSGCPLIGAAGEFPPAARDIQCFENNFC